MEFKEKLQELRKRKGLTQEELADALYVSRTAISKWESGRGMPGLASLKAIADYFSVSVDTLLSGEALLCLAENDRKETERRTRDLVFGLLDCGVSLLLFLPVFGQKTEDVVQGVSLLALQGVQPYLKVSYLVLVCLVAVLGVMTLALQNWQNRLWLQSKARLSLTFSTLGVCLFMLGQQPYAAVLTFAFLIIKAFLLIKRQ